MLRYKTKLDLVQSSCTVSGQETERVYSSTGARTGLCLCKFFSVYH